MAKQVATMSGAAARRERGRREMREMILAAARRTMTEEGIEALSMRGIARAIGYSPAALYEYFPAKDDVLAALYFEGAGGLSGRMVAAMAALPPDVSTADTLAALGRAYRAYALEQPELYQLVFGGIRKISRPPSSDEALDDTRGGFNVLVDVAARGVERGDFMPLPPPVIAVSAWAAVHGFVSLELSGHLAGGDGPGQPPPSPEESRARRDAMFEATLQVTLFGLTKR